MSPRHGPACAREPQPARRLEAIDRFHQLDIALLNQIEQRQTAVQVALRDRDDQPQVRLDQHFLGLLQVAFGRPDPAQSAWLYAQMVRWGQAPLSDDMCRAAMGVFRPDLYDAAVGAAPTTAGYTNGRIDAFAGTTFDPGNISAHLSSWRIGRVPVP